VDKVQASCHRCCQ